MAGMLNQKQRIMDVIITNNGRRQIADGTFEIKYASFSDHGVFYRDDGQGIADDASGTGQSCCRNCRDHHPPLTQTVDQVFDP